MILCNVLHIFFVWENCCEKNSANLNSRSSQFYSFPFLIIPVKFNIYPTYEFFLNKNLQKVTQSSKFFNTVGSKAVTGSMIYDKTTYE